MMKVNVVRLPLFLQVLSDMRMKINLPGDCRPSGGSPRKRLSSSIPSSSVTRNDPAYELLLFENIKMAALIHKFLAVNWLKVWILFHCIIMYVFSTPL